MPALTHHDFRRVLLEEFPQLRQEIEDSDGLLHIEMGVFAEHTQRAKGQGDWPTYERCIKLADRMWANPDAVLLNALNVSYLEYLDFDGPRGPKAWSLLTPPLQEGWKAIMQYLRKLGNAARKRGAPGSDGAA